VCSLYVYDCRSYGVCCTVYCVSCVVSCSSYNALCIVYCVYCKEQYQGNLSDSDHKCVYPSFRVYDIQLLFHLFNIQNCIYIDYNIYIYISNPSYQSYTIIDIYIYHHQHYSLHTHHIITMHQYIYSWSLSYWSFNTFPCRRNKHICTRKNTLMHMKKKTLLTTWTHLHADGKNDNADEKKKNMHTERKQPAY